MLFLKTISTQVQAIWQAITHSDIATGGSGSGTKVLYDDMTWKTPTGGSSGDYYGYELLPLEDQIYL